MARASDSVRHPSSGAFFTAASGPGIAASDAFRVLHEVRDYAIYMLDPDGRIVTWNEGARSIQGYAPEEIIGRDFAELFSEQDRQSGHPALLLSRARADGRVEDDGWRVRKDGQRFWANVVLTALHDERGRIRGFVAVARDLTQQREAERLVRESEQRMRLLLESVEDYAIFMLDPEGRVSTWNAGAQRINGYSASEVIGQHFSLFYPRQAVEARHPDYELTVAARDGRYAEEGWRVRKNGERYRANVVITAIYEPETGALRGFAKVTRDLTDLRRMEAVAQRAVERAGRERLRADAAQSALARRDEFISVAAHELRTPLAALLLKLQGIQHVLAPETASQPELPVASSISNRVDGALRQIDRLSALVERLLDVSKIVRGALELVLEDTNLSELAAHVTDDFRDAARQAGTNIQLTATPDVIAHVDRGRIEQVLVNLIANAIKYGSGKTVEVVVDAKGERARLRVTDHGIGIPEDDLERIFTRFERAAPARHYGGLGLGLYITKSIVDAHAGTIDVASDPGSYTTFVVELPLTPKPEKA